ncbi:amino acid ABC transporter permease/ATP-binding protein [Phyllobacterium sp. YR531]|uniref:amino acid ABC transporter permease/ATP-binding protein n=1 Tax=Phyllobacterium sp. YR531 TaxID=1144343 RepID=UPI00026FC3D4|nr:amino acid ABC transporter permease/ATP-binding protein [Phyllobacterium sp. YR531]EJN02382.1 ABC-type polar amino acid transport system, ATPase component [Phyllobacterium sp. YR531]
MAIATDYSSAHSLKVTPSSNEDYTHYKIVKAKYPTRFFGTLFAAFVIIAMLQSILTNSKWGWDVFAEWFFAEPVLAGLARTLLLTALASVLGFALGTALALARVSKSPLLSGLSWAYIWLLRSIPLIVLLLILNNLGYLYETVRIGIPYTDINFAEYPMVSVLSPFAAALIGLSLNQAAFSSEIIRGGILSVDQGQHEAAAALGLPRRRQAFRIVLPQAMRTILPTGFNEIIGLAKGTSMVYVLALPELFYTVQVIYRRNLEVVPLLMVATVWYLIIMTVLSVAQYYIERHFSKGALRNAPAPLFGPLLHRLFGAPILARPAFPTVSPNSLKPVSKTEAPRESFTQWRAPGAVRIHGVSKSFGQLKVLDNVRLDIKAGSVTAILGPSGSGKSTLLRTINHLERVDDGFITVDNELVGYRKSGRTLYELKEKDILKRRADIGMVFQSFNLFPHLTVLENIIEAPVSLNRLTRPEAINLARDLLVRVGLSDKINAYPRQLSGGQQQRVAIARALALRPKVLLFDEPTSALDPELVGEVLDVIKELARSGTTLIIVTHEIGFAREVADTVIFMDAGKIVETGSPEQVLNRPANPRTAEFLAKVL